MIGTDHKAKSNPYLAVESQLHYLRKRYFEVIQAPSDEWCKKAMTNEETPIWSICYGYILFHGCRSFLHRMHIHRSFIEDDTIELMDLENQGSNFQHHFDICCESANSITSFCRSLAKYRSNSKYLPTVFLMPLLQSSCIHILAAFIAHYSRESDKYHKSMRNFETNLKFIGWYITKQAHNLLIFETMKKLDENIFSIDKTMNKNAVRMAFSIVYQTMTAVIPSLFSKNVLNVNNSENIV